MDYEKFRAKVREFLIKHEDHVTIHKIRNNMRLIPNDLAELERMLEMNGVGPQELLKRAKSESHGLGLFVRSLIGLDRQAAKDAFNGFINDANLSANQIDFINIIIDHLASYGVISAELLYESPFTDLSPRGPDGLFTSPQIDALIDVLRGIDATAVAA